MSIIFHKPPQFFRFQLAILLLFSTRVYSLARFTNPPGPDGALTLAIGDNYTIEWENAGSDYSSLSLGLKASADGNIYWLFGNEKDYTSENFLFNVRLGNGITLDQGNIFSFIMVNGTRFGEYVSSSLFLVTKKGESPSSSSAATTATTISSLVQSSSSTSGTTTSAQNSDSATTTLIPISSTAFTSAIDAPSQVLPTTSSSATNATVRDSPPPSPSTTGLSKGAKIGIGISTSLSAILALSALLLLLRHKRRPKQELEHKDLYNSSPPPSLGPDPDPDLRQLGNLYSGVGGRGSASGSASGGASQIRVHVQSPQEMDIGYAAYRGGSAGETVSEQVQSPQHPQPHPHPQLQELDNSYVRAGAPTSQLQSAYQRDVQNKYVYSGDGKDQERQTKFAFMGAPIGSRMRMYEAP